MKTKPTINGFDFDFNSVNSKILKILIQTINLPTHQGPLFTIPLFRFAVAGLSRYF